MEYARNAVLKNPQWEPLISSIDLIETSINSNHSYIFDHAKSLVETVCKTILNDLGIAYEENEDLPRLARLTIRGLVSEELCHPEEISKLEKLINSLTSMITSLCEFRNGFGFISHGRDIDEEKASQFVADFVMRASSLIVGFLINLYGKFIDIGQKVRIRYEDYSEFNAWFDSMNEDPKIGDLAFSASEVLYKVDPIAYKEELVNYSNQEIL